MARRDLADAFAAPFVELSAELDAIAEHEAASRNNAAATWDAIAGVGAQLDQLHAADVESNRGLSALASELAEQRQAVADGYGVLAQVNVTLGKVADNLSKTRALEAKRLAAMAADMPIWHRPSKAATYPSSGALAVFLPGPSVGRVQHVKRLVVGGQSLSTSAAGTAEVYVTGWIPDAQAAGSVSQQPSSLSDLVDATILIGSSFTALPNIANYEDGQVVVQHGEHLWVVIRSGTPGQQYVVGATAKDLRDHAHPVEFTEG